MRRSRSTLLAMLLASGVGSCCSACPFRLRAQRTSATRSHRRHYRLVVATLRALLQTSPLAGNIPAPAVPAPPPPHHQHWEQRRCMRRCPHHCRRLLLPVASSPSPNWEGKRATGAARVPPIARANSSGKLPSVGVRGQPQAAPQRARRSRRERGHSPVSTDAAGKTEGVSAL